MITSNLEIMENLKDCEHFLGCFSISNLPNFPKTIPSSLILNLKGHWVAVMLLEETCLYFDSFGNRNICSEIIDFLGVKYTSILINTVRIQNYSSIKCAEFCLAFIKNVDSCETYLSFLNKFDIKSRKNNDNIVKQLY